ncbi:uncharacterized protein LOC119743003 [Patiria miniata]|uniref:YqaJ viral recombinase domain-containing protein n=1 Tax=Patiria miniata TaxID=46514 RepID=A0A914BH67_PATMI|nr:uncharacterized protein LOC119743003 [Patiria miniata]XP_038075232.1 uncharacterized protein LOC119743003 [Patiria miniata]XP_038075233.1 uncharacterized protein LOC119743003 [Patiria miniata]XP_038075234.1 uncharacterized protein LOC119743003 [Patiria miniata]XP_038075235.1 uncharacterized protein LOC119743003 [Patiria miniata]XP_038075236.1 uncharacterized protein LOC119743003 [Patiria miniata]XP_038075237.1 uncharacterized protein LOC119743003 [Patiria miniata]XP_038075238.1 uncharacte
MPETSVIQRSSEWFELRQHMQLTASKFGDAIGVGQGRPYDFFLSLLSDDACSRENEESEHTRHGTQMEPIIDEAYQLLTGNTTHAAGFWQPPEGSILHGLCGATPDGKILSTDEPVKLLGLVEYKAPFYRMYDPSKHPHGIPRHYMAQIQGQMGICEAPWCDFMAVCTQTRAISLQRVYFNRTYWQCVAKKLRQFCLILKEAKQRRVLNQQALNFPGIQRLKAEPIARTLLPGENSIRVENLLEVDSKGQFRSLSGTWMAFDFLMGNPVAGTSSLQGYQYEWILREIDSKIRNRNAPAAAGIT